MSVAKSKPLDELGAFYSLCAKWRRYKYLKVEFHNGYVGQKAFVGMDDSQQTLSHIIQNIIA